MQYKQIIKKLRSMANPKNIEGMARFGISSKNTLGVSIPVLRKMAAAIGRDQALALKLWGTGIHEARLLACFVADPQKTTNAQVEKWVRDVDSWDICDQFCTSFLDKTKFGHVKVRAWSKRKEEFVKRAAFSLIAGLAVHDKEADDAVFKKYLQVIKRQAADDRNYVKKAVNWALRNIGKRNVALNQAAIKTAKDIRKIDARAARWIAADALRELKNAKIQKRLKERSK